MSKTVTLAEHLDHYAAGLTLRQAVAAAVAAVAEAATDISARLAEGELAGPIGRAAGINSDGDDQKDIDLFADQRLRRALAAAPIAALASEEAAHLDILDPAGPISISIDPLDGSSNLDTNMSVGTIFSILPTASEIEATFSRAGSGQLAAGFTIYGPQTSLVLTLGEGVDIFTLDRAVGQFRLVRRHVKIPADSLEFAINASNQLFWDPPVRAYIQDCLAHGAEPGGKPANMRWIGSLVAESFRILTRGGVFLYPADSRKGYNEGRLRLLYEAHPMAFIMEQAGGSASNGTRRILDLAADVIHRRVPLVMGSRDNVARVERLHHSPDSVLDRNAPLFAARGLFRV
jgi:fructose-1,6-bisphosphatase I